MGAWGYGCLDNDAALEIQHLWESKIKGWVENNNWTPKQVAEYFIEKHWGDAVRYGDSITNAEILALVELFRAENLKLPSNLMKVAERAINRELVVEVLQEWEYPEKRRESLLELMDFIGGVVKPPPKEKRFNDPSIHYKNTMAAKQSLQRLIDFCCNQGGYYGPFYWLKYPNYEGVTEKQKQAIDGIDRKNAIAQDFRTAAGAG